MNNPDFLASKDQGQRQEGKVRWERAPLNGHSSEIGPGDAPRRATAGRVRVKPR